ncbi:DUF3658 domain-containing protein [Niabella drilacis]|uniref:DUF1835 domain-containing protein n=1 Tax=Niabella drilacis (strain DSM 25811 / CCM 8410 / CCUG 62505 / LMG 26954 / E90) TaxID=1285928 RepID=A0A1G7AA01_NIADE|nr:DUF3658 domain-containing protein [Niabella drilacis]SDE11327.1 protein of unknown function [Niabella drilacis]
MTDLHLTSHPGTAGSLCWGIQKNKLAGDVIVIEDTPGIGPLDDGKKRAAFLQSMGFEEYYMHLGMVETDAFAPWLALQERLRQNPAGRLVLWAGSDANDYIFIRMACYWLRGIDVKIALIQVPPLWGHHSISAHSMPELVSMLHQAVPLNRAKRERFAKQFEQIAARPELLRECDENGVLRFKDLSVYDGDVLGYCSRRWKPAVRMVGEIMGRSDGRNPLGELFACSRLKHLVLSGDLEADGPLTSMRTFRVRLAKKHVQAPATTL